MRLQFLVVVGLHCESFAATLRGPKHSVALVANHSAVHADVEKAGDALELRTAAGANKVREQHFHAALNASGVHLAAGRPACASDLTADDPYWLATEETYGMGHHKCITEGGTEHGTYGTETGCPRVSNADRVKALRGLLKATDTLMKSLKMDYFLYGGTAIGQYRCGDVLPWDGDNDVLVPRKDIFRMHEILYGRPYKDMATDAAESGGSRGFGEYSQDLAAWGVPGFKLMKKSNCIIYELVDLESGFITDIWPIDYEGGAGLVPWPQAMGPATMITCSTWTRCASSCYQYWDANYWPIEDCTISGHSMRCAKDRGSVLVTTYGANVLSTPDVAISR